MYSEHEPCIFIYVSSPIYAYFYGDLFPLHCPIKLYVFIVNPCVLHVLSTSVFLV
jgi:hypothetical protein